MVHDPKALRCATESHPILAVNRATKKCMLVKGYKRTPGTVTETPVIGGGTERSVSSYNTELLVRTPGTNTTMKIADEASFMGQFQLQDYRCDGERSVAVDATGEACWRSDAVRPRHDGDGGEERVEL